MAAPDWRRMFRKAFPALLGVSLVAIPVAILAPAIRKARRAAEASTTT